MVTDALFEKTWKKESCPHCNRPMFFFNKGICTPCKNEIKEKLFAEYIVNFLTAKQ